MVAKGRPDLVPGFRIRTGQVDAANLGADRAGQRQDGDFFVSHGLTHCCEWHFIYAGAEIIRERADRPLFRLIVAQAQSQVREVRRLHDPGRPIAALSSSPAVYAAATLLAASFMVAASSP